MPHSSPRVILPLLLSLLAGMSIHPARAQQNEARVAAIIGNAAYPDAEAALKDPINNARALAEELRRHGFEVDSSENLTKEAMRAALDRFYAKIKSGSTALLFFSGYGIQSDRQTYMIPVNAQIWTEPDVRRDGYSLDSVLAEMNSRGARVKIAILDASRRNPFERRFRAVAGGLAPVSVPKGTVVMYAAAPGAVVRDGDRQVFISELIKEIRGGGRIEEAFNRTLVGVSRASQGEQVPWFSSSLVDEFSFTTSGRMSSASTSTTDEREKKTVAPVAPPPPPPPPPSAPDPDVDARAAYQSAERIGTKKGWEDFLSKYRSGRYADLAREQLAKLTPPIDDPAIKELDDKIRRNPNDSAAYYKRGQLYAQYEDFTRAVKDFDAVIRLSPKDAEALNNRCWANAMIAELQAALKDCDAALALRPSYVDALDSRGFVNLKMGQPSKAIADYDAALRINPKQASSLYGRGIAKLRIGNSVAGNGDIAAAKLIQSNIAEEFERYGIH
jgi:Caspase domain/Tetratricopeptide repeat